LENRAKITGDKLMSIHTGKYVSYLRVSTEKQGVDGNGIEAQRMTINKHLNGGDWELLAEYAEQISGKTAMRNRPELRAAIKFALENDATLIFAKMDRALRKLDVLIEILNSGVRTVFCDGQAIDVQVPIAAIRNRGRARRRTNQ
jgi:DNA invertase Pin-like site-specific DNA recombinase